MSNNKVTIQDIADALGISRNTVSKALNNTGTIADHTKQKILEKAIDMGYKQHTYMAPTIPEPQVENREIALFTQSFPNSSHFASHLINTFQEKISALNYKFSIYLVRESELANAQLPAGFQKDTTDGIMCIELFDSAYSYMLSKLQLPLLMVDTDAKIDFLNMNSDFLFMENQNCVSKMTSRFIRNGIQRLAFAGDIYHCHSFHERYSGFMHALKQHNMNPCTVLFTDHDSFIDPENLIRHFNDLSELPEIFICANDFVAIDLIKAMKKLNIVVPDDILICGFDDSAESRVIEPHLTTIQIPSESMGYIAADLLLSKIRTPDMPDRVVHVRTEACYRESTGKLPVL